MARSIRIFIRLLLTITLVLSGILAFAPTARATGGYPYASYLGPGSNPAGYYWTDYNGNPISIHGYYYRNCTDYVAWKLNTLGIPYAATQGLGNAGMWHIQASRRSGVSVSQTPAYGAVAVRPGDPNGVYIERHGHVAFVESVHGDGTISISEYNYGGNGEYHVRRGTPTGMGFTHFVHFGLSTGQTMTQSRFAIITPDSQIYAKDSLSNGNWLHQGTQANKLFVGGRRMALINSVGRVYAKDTLNNGGWIDQSATAKQIDIGSAGRMIIITSGNWVYAKDTLTGGWINQNAQAIKVAVGHARVALINSCGAVYAKDHLGSGGWVQQSGCGVAQDVKLDPSGRIAILTPDGHIYAKNNISGLGGWIDQAATASQIELGGNRMIIRTTSGRVYAKDHINPAGWIDQGALASSVAITSDGRMAVLVPGGHVYAKDHIGPAGWLIQGAVASQVIG